MIRNIKTIVLGLVFTSASFASLINFPNGQTNYVSAECTNFTGYWCTTTAYFDDHSLDDQNDGQNISSLFISAFDAWNATNAVGSKWTLNAGGSLNGTFDIDPATAQQFGPVVSGGLTINVALNGVTLPTLGAGDTLAWSQGLFDNYLLNGSIVTPFYEMDIVTACAGNGGPATTFCPPAYPFQYNDNSFYDQPKASYKAPGSTQAFFDANAYLSVINYGNRTLTVYDGVSYGFQNYVGAPEPGTWVLLFSGVVIIVAGRKRRVTQ